MTSYRFCRSDDIPLLVEAYNRCYRPHFPNLENLDVDGFKSLIRSHDLWTSSCMVAHDGSDPIAVLFSAKREDASLIYCLGVHADHQRQGHGRHLLTSLSQKLAILGPPKLLAEVPDSRLGGRALLEASGYTLEWICSDWRRESGVRSSPTAADDLIVPVTARELESQSLLRPPPDLPWLRAETCLFSDDTSGFAVLSELRVEAWILVRPSFDGSLTVLTMGATPDGHRAPLLALLLDRTERELPGRHLLMPALLPDELPAPLMEALGFKEVSRTAFYSAEATPA